MRRTTEISDELTFAVRGNRVKEVNISVADAKTLLESTMVWSLRKLKNPEVKCE